MNCLTCWLAISGQQDSLLLAKIEKTLWIMWEYFHATYSVVIGAIYTWTGTAISDGHPWLTKMFQQNTTECNKIQWSIGNSLVKTHWTQLKKIEQEVIWWVTSVTCKTLITPPQTCCWRNYKGENSRSPLDWEEHFSSLHSLTSALFYMHGTRTRVCCEVTKLY